MLHPPLLALLSVVEVPISHCPLEHEQRASNAPQGTTNVVFASLSFHLLVSDGCRREAILPHALCDHGLEEVPAWMLGMVSGDALKTGSFHSSLCHHL